MYKSMVQVRTRGSRWEEGGRVARLLRNSTCDQSGFITPKAYPCDQWTSKHCNLFLLLVNCIHHSSKIILVDDCHLSLFHCIEFCIKTNVGTWRQNLIYENYNKDFVFVSLKKIHIQNDATRNSLSFEGPSKESFKESASITVCSGDNKVKMCRYNLLLDSNMSFSKKNISLTCFVSYGHYISIINQHKAIRRSLTQQQNYHYSYCWDTYLLSVKGSRMQQTTRVTKTQL